MHILRIPYPSQLFLGFFAVPIYGKPERNALMIIALLIRNWCLSPFQHLCGSLTLVLLNLWIKMYLYFLSFRNTRRHGGPEFFLMGDKDLSKDDSRFAPNQWETALLCSDVSHWMGASLESALLSLWYNQNLVGWYPGDRNTPVSAPEGLIYVKFDCVLFLWS